MGGSFNILKWCPFMVFLLVGRIAVVANEVFISTWMLVRSVLEPQNLVCIVDRRLEFCVCIIDLCLGEDECHCRWGEISFWRLYFQNQTMHVEFLTVQVNILGFWLIPISKTAAMNTLIWATPTDRDCFAVACQLWSQDLISMPSCPCTLGFHNCAVRNKNTIQIYHQRNGQIWVHKISRYCEYVV